MCLPVAMARPHHVLSKGEHQGFEWMTVHNGRGFRCGYVRIPKGHPWHGITPDPSIHGGLTYAEADEPCDGDRPDNAWWLGFDCAHSGDAPDPRLLCDQPRHAYQGDTVKTQGYVEAECQSLCEQAKDAREMTP